MKYFRTLGTIVGTYFQKVINTKPLIIRFFSHNEETISCHTRNITFRINAFHFAEVSWIYYLLFTMFFFFSLTPPQQCYNM